MSRTGYGKTGERVIYASKSRNEFYHTKRRCPHVSPGFLVLAVDGPRARRIREEREECSWCKYDANDALEL